MLAPPLLPCAALCNSYFGEELEGLTGAQDLHKSLNGQKVLLAQEPPLRPAHIKPTGMWRERLLPSSENGNKNTRSNLQEKLTLIFPS